MKHTFSRFLLLKVLILAILNPAYGDLIQLPAQFQRFEKYLLTYLGEGSEIIIARSIPIDPNTEVLYFQEGQIYANIEPLNFNKPWCKIHFERSSNPEEIASGRVFSFQEDASEGHRLNSVRINGFSEIQQKRLLSVLDYKKEVKDSIINSIDCFSSTRKTAKDFNLDDFFYAFGDYIALKKVFFTSRLHEDVEKYNGARKTSPTVDIQEISIVEETSNSDEAL